MQRLALLAIPMLLFSHPALSADLDGYRERDVVIERAPPRVVERTRIIERHHYHQAAPVYIEPRAYYAPRVYEETYYDRPSSSLRLRRLLAPAALLRRTPPLAPASPSSSGLVTDHNGPMTFRALTSSSALFSFTRSPVSGIGG